MVRSADESGKRRKAAYLAVSAVVLAIAIYADFSTSSSNNGLLSEESTPRPARGASFLPVFTTPVFILILMVGMFSLGSREKWASEHEEMGGVSSAYSVFNDGGRTMAGGMTAKELDGQLRGGPVGRYGDDAGSDDSRRSNNVRTLQQRKPSTEIRKDEGAIDRQRRERAEAAMRRMKQS